MDPKITQTDKRQVGGCGRKIDFLAENLPAKKEECNFSRALSRKIKGILWFETAASAELRNGD